MGKAGNLCLKECQSLKWNLRIGFGSHGVFNHQHLVVVKNESFIKKTNALGGILLNKRRISWPGIERLNMTLCRIWKWIEYYIHIGVDLGK